MRRLFVDRKSGFDVKDTMIPIVIRDSRGISFYDTNGLGDVTKFNMPPGEYFVDSGNFVKSSTVRIFPSIRLPFRERFLFPNPENFAIVFANNPNKCTVNWSARVITFDNSFHERPLPQIWMIFYHECGHRLYSTEEYCDLYAAKCMLHDGYNPSQIGYSIIDSLSDKQDLRKNIVIDSFNKSK